MAECGISPVGCLKEIGKSITTECLWPPIKHHIDYWWCFDNNIKDLRDGVRDLNWKIHDLKQKIKEAEHRTDILRPEVEKWLKDASQKHEEAIKNLQDDNIPKSWDLISRYSMGKRAKKAAEEIAEQRNGGNFNAIADPAPPPATRFRPPRPSMNFESRKHIEEEIIESLRSCSVGMIGICGMGGVGKTTMAQRIRERMMEEKLFDEVVMVAVSQQIDMFKIQDEIAEWLKLKFDEKHLSTRADKLQMRLMDSKRKIIIFDDVWESLKFEDLGIPFESDFERCKVLLTSRSTDTCKGIKNKKVFELKILEEAEAWILFKEKAGECVEDSALLSVAKDVVAECKGLPIALVTVATALQNEMDKSIWEDSLLQLRQCNPIDLEQVLEYVYNPLKLSYDYLESDSQKKLFLLCCLFPEDYDIPVEELTLYSMGLRLFDGISSIKEARNRMNSLLKNLKSRFLLIDSRKELHVRMHDVVRDVAIYIGSKEKNGFLKSLNKTSILSSSDVKCNWMTVDISNERIEIPVVLRFPKLPKLCLLMLKSSDAEFSDISFEGMENLNVLTFSSTRIGSLPPTMGLLQNLRTLRLLCCKVENISVIGELTSLEVFSCNECYNIKELPAEIGRLNCLRLLELNECCILQRIPFGIFSSLVGLEELKMLRSFHGWEAEENGKEMRNASLTELECLPKLSCLEIEISDSNLASQEICLFPKLVKYKIYIASKIYWFENCEKAMSLNLPCEIGAVGNWILRLVRISESLSLKGDGSNNFNIAEVENLRNLRIWNCSRVKNLVKTKDCKSGIVFPLLEILCLRELENLEEICDGTIILNQNVSLCNLKSIEISECSNLRTLFSVSMARSSLLQLEVLEIDDCDAMERVFWNDITDDTDASIEFPKLKKLSLIDLPNLTAFCQGVETIKFPKLIEMGIGGLPKLNCLCPLNSETPHDNTTSFHFLCNQKVKIGGLEILSVGNCFNNNLRNIWCHQIPINFFKNLQNLYIWCLNGITSLMPYSIAKNLVSLKSLEIVDCKEMVEVIEGNDDDIEVLVDDIKCLFPTLITLDFWKLHKLRRFWQWNQSLELPLLEEVTINDCPVIETFTMGCINTPKLKWLNNDGQAIYSMKDLNDIIIYELSQNIYTTEELEEDEDEDEDENENEDKDKDKDEGERK